MIKISSQKLKSRTNMNFDFLDFINSENIVILRYELVVIFKILRIDCKLMGNFYIEFGVL